MTTMTTVPVRISDEAAAHVDKLGLRAPMEQMIEHMKEVVPSLRAIVVTYEISPEDPTEDPLVFIWGYGDDDAPVSEDLHVRQELRRWAIESFRPNVNGHLLMSLATGEIDER